MTYILQYEVYLARILQETCQKNALSCKILESFVLFSTRVWRHGQIFGKKSTTTPEKLKGDLRKNMKNFQKVS